MSGIRDLIAVVLGVCLGLTLIAAPRVALRLSVVPGSHRGRRGDYGTDGNLPETWVWVVRLLGLGCLVVATGILWGAYGPG